jgi:probable rRNA maturation factor
MASGSPSPARAGFRNAAQAQPTILIQDAGWRRLVPQAARLAARAAMAAGGAGTVVLSSDRAVKALNALHRRRNKPTNVLTFDLDPGPHSGFLGGDIVLALGTVRREASAAGRSPAHHLAHLVVHGALHLRGHDHHHVGEARRMEMAEARILSRIGVPNPWRHK